MNYTPAVITLNNKSLFEDGNLVLFIIALVCRLVAIGVSIRLLVRNTPLLKRFSPNELQKPFHQLSKQQQYRYICSICLFSTLVFHLVNVLLDMMVMSPGTPLSYQSGKVNITIIVSLVSAFAYIVSLWSTILWLILTEIDRYNRVTLVVRHSMRAKIIHRVGQAVKVFTLFTVLFYSVTIPIYIRNEAMQSNIFPIDTMNWVAAIRDGFAAVVTALEIVLECYLNMSMVRYVLYKSTIKPSMATTEGVKYRTRILVFLIGVLLAHLLAISLMYVGVLSGPFHPLVLLSISTLSMAVSTSFSLTDTLLNCLQESKQEHRMGGKQVDLTGYKTGTDFIEEGLLISGPARTQYTLDDSVQVDEIRSD